MRKNLREPSDRSTQPSDRSKNAQRLQEHRNHHQRFTHSPKDKALMTTSMQMEEEKQKEEAHFQAMQEYFDNMSTIAAKRGVTSDETLPRKKVPPRYQERLSGGGPEKAKKYFDEVTRGLSPNEKQILREKFYGYTNTRNKYTIQQRNKYWELYNEPDEKFGQSSASSQRQGASRESENKRSTRSSYREVSEAESESEEPSYKGDSNESALVPLDGFHPYFPVRYPSDSGREVYISDIVNACAIDTAMMILRDQGKHNVRESEVEDFYSNCNLQEKINREYTPSLLKHFGSVPYEYKEYLSLSDLHDRLKTGYSIISSISFIINGERKFHSIVVDDVEKDDYGYARYVHIRDSREPDPYKVTIDAWENVWNNRDVVPVISGSDDDSQEGTSYSQPPQASSWDNSYHPYPPSYGGGGYNPYPPSYGGGYNPWR